MLIRLFFILLFATSVHAQDSFENTMKKIEMLEGNNTKVEYDKIQPIKKDSKPSEDNTSLQEAIKKD